MAANLTVIGLLFLLSFLQRPGRITFDTKFDLTASPGDFLERTLRLWNPALSFGELQNQAYGYLFPQGLFAWLTELAGVPDWVAQRLWMALVMVLAYDGARRLYRALEPGASWVWGLVAGVAFALAPRFLGLVGVLSAEVLPTAVLPWIVLPLVHAFHGRMTPRVAGLSSGCAVLLMGGVNAVENIAALPLPALLLLFGIGSSAGRRLAGWWVLGVSLASAWWMLPLLVLGRYSPPFLDYIETAAATTFPLGWTNVVRGSDHWVAFMNVGGRPWWPGAYDLAWDPWLVAVTGLVAAVSLLGLFHSSMPLRTPFALSAVLGMCLLTVAHLSVLSSPLSGVVRELLDGPLAMLRNVHKVDPLVRLPMALGFAHAARLLAPFLSARLRGLRPRPAQALAVGASAVLLVASVQPGLEGDLRKEGWREVPQAWLQVGDWLADEADGRRALILPGSGFGQQQWGWTIDEPIQGVASTPWVSRSQVPLVPGPTIRFLDGVEERIQDGRGSLALADTLARAGIGYVVVRRDLDLYASGATRPARVSQALARSPGLTRVARFGRTGFGNQASLVVFAVDRDVPLVEVVERKDIATLVGGPEDVMTAIESGLLDADRPVVIGTMDTLGEAPQLVADGYRKRERQFGRLVDSLSQTMTDTEPYRIQRAARDYPGVPGVPRARAVYSGIESLHASSSSGYADTLGPVRPELGPYSAVDAVAKTYWRSATLEDPVGQWLELRLAEPRPLPYVDLHVGVDSFSGVPVRRVRVETDDDESDVTVDPDTGRLRVPLRGTPVDRVRVTVLDVAGDPPTGVVAIREIGLPTVSVERRLELPDVGANGETSFIFRAAPGRRACVHSRLGPTCDPDEERPGEEESGLHRVFSTSESATFRARGTVVARPSPQSASLMAPLGGFITVEASSVLADDPAVSGQFALDGRVRRPWLAQQGDLQPSLLLTWDEPRSISRIRVRPSLIPSRAPTTAILEGPIGQRREVALGSGALGFFEPIVTRRLLVSLPAPEAPGGRSVLPIGVGELELDGLQDLKYTPDLDDPTGAPCGFGPQLEVDGQVHPTRVTGTLRDAAYGTPMTWEACGGPLTLGSGRHELSIASTDRFTPAAAALESQDRYLDDVAGVGTRDVEIRTWASTRRIVEVGPGDEAVLRVPENVNEGWRATLNGEELASSPIDGWQQGWVVPAGEGGVVRLEFTPDRPYRAALLAGALSALLRRAGTGLALLRARNSTVAPAPPLIARLAFEPLRVSQPWGVIGVAAVAFLLGGAGLAVGCAAGFLLGRRARWLLGAGLVALATCAAAVAAAIDRPEAIEVLDVGVAIAVGLLVMCLVERAPRR
ncbi:MAG: alpha-(1-_3)-arabinofuranosyltransferase domain-containing protein [Nocardioides sp.]